MKIAIDGPAGSGKSSVSKEVAKKLGFTYIDTGAMYRAVGLAVVNYGFNTKDKEKVLSILDDIDITLENSNDGQKIFLNGKDVSDEIRLPIISVAASNVAVIPEVRLKLVELQRELAKTCSVVMDGRDIGTYVLPDAELKIFLTASVEERARRRYKELCEKGVECDYESVKADMEYRDKNDSGREMAPLKAADDGIIVDTTNLTIDETIERIVDEARKKGCGIR